MDNFEPTEPLYWRCQRQHTGETGELLRSGIAIRFPDFSVNRGGDGFGDMGDVLEPDWPDFGVATFLVKDLPTGFRSDSNTSYDFKVFHDPLEENYAHSEVRAMKNGEYCRDVAKTVKKQMRQVLGERMKLVIAPQV